MKCVILLLVVIMMWYLCTSQTTESFTDSVYDLVWVKHQHQMPFEETLRWNIYKSQPPKINIGQEGVPLTSQQKCIKSDLQNNASKSGFAPKYCHGADSNSADTMRQCIHQGGAAIPCLCKDYSKCIQNRGDPRKCQQDLSYRGCMSEPDANIVNC